MTEQLDLTRPVPPAPAADGYGAFRAALIARIVADNLTPAQVSVLLSEAIDRFPGRQLHIEAHVLESAGEQWADVRVYPGA
jgi:hypothetical protein